jgi:reactive intermediate/imine deaminase
MRSFMVLAGVLVCVLASVAAEKRLVFPPGVKPVGPYSPGILVGDYLYVSGQGAGKADKTFPTGTEAQVRQSLENVKRIVEAAGLTMQHIVYTHLYLSDPTKYDEANRAWKEYFPKDPPARATLGVARMPTDTPVEVTVVAVRDLSKKKLVVPPGYPSGGNVTPAVMVGDRVFVSGFLGRDIKTGRIPDDPAAQVQLSLDRMKETLAAAGLDFRHMVFVNPYLTEKMPMNVMNQIYAKHFEFGNTPARATIRVAGLPHGANIEFTGIAVRDLSKRRAVRPKNMPPSATASPCVFAEDTLYCSAKSGFIPGPHSGIYASTVEHQVRQTMRNLLDGLEEGGLNFSNVVATNVYLDDMEDFAHMNKTYGEYFPNMPPTRTTVQQIAPVKERKADESGRWPGLEQVSLIAVQ